MDAHTRSGRRVFARAAIVAVLAAGILVTSAGALGATSGGCGEYSYGFTGTRLINDGISTSAGPFTISLPAGTYDIKMLSNDNHPSADYQVQQTQEQWYFKLDSGYISPPTKDVPSDQTAVTTEIGEVELAAATAISVHHLGEGGVNSVNVECVGFTPSNIAVAGPAVEPDVVTTTTIAVAAPTTAPPAKVIATPTTAAVATTVPTEVKAVVETPPVAQLAVTGQRSSALMALGIVLIAFGLGCVHVEHKVTTATSRT